MPDRPTCKSCPYWQEHEYDDTKDPAELTAGICRRNAPSAAMTRVLNEEPIEQFPVWPETFSTDFCGEHPDFAAFLAGRKTSLN